jgi:hypothetical protein
MICPTFVGFFVFRWSTLKLGQVQADQEDGTIKIDLPFLKHQAPYSWGFLFVG